MIDSVVQMESGIVNHSLDECPKGSTGSENSVNFGDIGWNWPILNGSDSRGIQDSSSIGAEMSEDVSARDSDKYSS